MERPVLTGRGHDRSPAPAGPRVLERDLGDAGVTLARLLVGADHVKGEVLERPQAHTLPLRQSAVLAVPSVVDLIGRPGEPVAMERAVDDGRDPPAGDRVLAELEEAGGHLSRPWRGCPIAPSRPRRHRSTPGPPRRGCPT